jgi:hypothetical protein
LVEFFDCAYECFGPAQEEDVNAGEGDEGIGDGGLDLRYVSTFKIASES